jgi:hypothetical protein
MSNVGKFIERMKRKHANNEGLFWTEYTYLRTLAKAYGPADSWDLATLLARAEKNFIERMTARLTQ